MFEGHPDNNVEKTIPDPEFEPETPEQFATMERENGLEKAITLIVDGIPDAASLDINEIIERAELTDEERELLRTKATSKPDLALLAEAKPIEDRIEGVIQALLQENETEAAA